MAHQHFSIEEREYIQHRLWEKKSIRAIARDLGRSPSSVSREVNRNVPPAKRRYTPRLAELRAQEKRHATQGRLQKEGLKEDVIRLLKEGWSPEQVAGDLGTISHETIYQFIYDAYKNGGEDLRPLLKRRHKARLERSVRKWQRLPNPNKPSIEARPKVVGKRTRLGDWEGDLWCHAHQAWRS